MMSRSDNNRRNRSNKANANMPGPRSRGMQRAGMPHAENIKPQRDIYNNPRFCDVFARLKGSVVFVQVKSGTEYEGILHTISPKGEIVLMEVRTKDHTKQKVTLHPKLILECSSIVKITAKEVNLDYSSKPESFATDAEISQRVNGQVPERKLEAWAPIEDDVADKRLLEVELDTTDLTKGNGWDAADMFATNQRDFGYESTFKEDLQEYTTPLPEEDTKEFRERRARADRLAKQIEQSPEHANRGQVENSDDMTEEERFSAVSRVGMNSRPVPQNSSNNTDKYVPPQKRQTGAGVYPRSGQGRKQSPSRTPMSGPGRPPVMGVDRQTPQAQAVVQTFRHTHQPSKQQQAPPPSAGQTGAMSSDYNRVQPHHSPQSQPKSQHHHSSVPQQPPYQQRPPVVGGVVGPRGQAPSLNPMGPKPLPPSIDNEQKRVAPQSDKQPLPSSEVALQRPDSLNHPNVDTSRSAAPNQIPSLATTTEGQTVPDKSPARTTITRDLKTFSENFGLSTDKKEIAENKVPALSTTLPPSTMEVSAEIISPSVTGGPTRPPADSPAQPEMKAAGTSPVIMVVPKKTPVPSSVEKERTEAVKSQISEKPKLNPHAKVFIPRALPQKTPTPPPSRSPVSQLATSQMIAAAHYMPQSMAAAMYGQGGPYMVTSNAPPGSLQQYTQIPKQVHAQRGTPRVDYINSFTPALAAGQPLVTPIQQGQQYITVTTGGQGMQQPGSIKVMPTMLNHVIKQPTMSYRQLPNNNPAVQTMHPQSQQLVQGADGVILPQMMAFPSQAAAAQSQSLQQQHSQGSAPSNQYMHTAPSHANAANQMQQSHHTTPPLQQSQQPQSSNHAVIASQGQFPQHGGRPSPGPMQPQMTHAQAQAQVVQPQGGMPQLVAVSQGGQQAIVYTSLPSQHGHGIPTQHASQQYSNIPQHINQQPNMQVQPTHVPSNMTNITNVTRVHPDPHPHPHPAAPTLYMNQSQAGMVQSHQLPGSYLQQHGAAYQPGN